MDSLIMHIYNSKVYKTFSKNVQDVGMALPKTTESKCRDMAYKHCTNNLIPTSFFVHDIFL